MPKGHYIRTEIIKRKISNKLKGFKHSEITKKKMSRRLKERWKNIKYRKEKIKNLKKLKHSIKAIKKMSNKKFLFWSDTNNKLKFLIGKNNPNWKNGRKECHGYIFIYSPSHPYANQKYVAEHRLSVEKQIGRYLKSQEEPHHLGKKDDNRPEMLICFSSHSAHIRFERGKDTNSNEIIFDGRNFKH